MGSQMVIENSKALCGQQPTPRVAADQITDSLGRARICSVRPSGEHGLFVIPGTAYRLLTDFLKFDHSFCNYALPKFLPYGWVSLTFLQPRREANQEEQQRTIKQLAILPDYALTTYGPRTAARHAKATSCVLCAMKCQ